MTIKINGIEYPIKFGMAALTHFCRAEGIPLSTMDKGFLDMDLYSVATLIYYAIRQGCRIERIGVDIEIDNIIDGFDYDKNLFNTAMELFAQSQISGDQKDQKKK